MRDQVNVNRAEVRLVRRWPLCSKANKPNLTFRCLRDWRVLSANTGAVQSSSACTLEGIFPLKYWTADELSVSAFVCLPSTNHPPQFGQLAASESVIRHTMLIPLFEATERYQSQRGYPTVTSTSCRPDLRKHRISGWRWVLGATYPWEVVVC